MRETLQDIHADGASRAEAESGFKALCSWMMRSRLEPMKTLAARQLRRHRDDVLTYFSHRCTNAVLEGLNSVIQNVKIRARGFRNMDYFSTMIYLTCSRLDLNTVTTWPASPHQTAKGRILKLHIGEVQGEESAVAFLSWTNAMKVLTGGR